MAIINGTSGADELEGTSNVDTINGLAGNDVLFGGDGSDALNGGGGADVLVPGEDLDRVDGGAGFDLVSYYDSDGAVVINLASSTATGGAAEGDTLVSVEDLEGSGFADRLTGNAGENFLYGLAGADALAGGGGDDLLVGGAGRDVLDGGDGFDVVSYYSSARAVDVSLVRNYGYGGDAEGDSLRSIEHLHGSAYNDQLTGGLEANFLYGLDGSDRLVGYDGDDILIGGAGGDAMDGGRGIDLASYYSSSAGVNVNLSTLAASGGDAAGDVFRLIEDLEGSDFADNLVGNAKDNLFNGRAGDDILSGGAGDDLLRGAAGADRLNGGIGSDTASYFESTAAVRVNLGTAALSGGSAAGDVLSSIENINGSAFGDALFGDARANLLQGFDGDDIVVGGDGDDTLIGWAGSDRLNGGSGRDLVSYAASEAAISVDLLAGTATGGDATGDTLKFFEDVEGSGLGDAIIGNQGPNALRGLAGNDSLVGGLGDDRLDGGVGIDRMEGGSGNDTYVIDKVGDLVVELASSGGNDTVESRIGIALAANVENLKLTGNNPVKGVGNTLDNAIFGNVGANTLIGGLGKDRLTGGDGPDRFCFRAVDESGVGAANRDAIFDFNRREGDRIDLTTIDADAGAGANQAFVFRGTLAFSGRAGQLRQAVSGDNAIVQGDVDGDGVADFEIAVIGSIALRALDFLL